jgi:small subunit ribosomal protein S20
MANTRQSTKRARQANTRRDRNIVVRSATRSAVKAAVDSTKAKDVALTKKTYLNAVKALASAASKGAIPKARAARKISRLTKLLQKTAPSAL